MSKKQLIKSVELDLGGKTVKLTIAQAQALKEALDELFAKEVVIEKEYVPVPSIPTPYPVPYEPYRPIRPWYWERDRWLDGTRIGDIRYCSNSGVTGGFDGDVLSLSVT